MKRHLAAFAVTILLCSLAACGETAAPASGTEPALPPQASSGTKAPTDSSAPAEAAVSVGYAPDELLSAEGACEEYDDGNSDYQVKVVFTANKDIRAFQYLEIGFREPRQNEEIQFQAEKVLYETDTLTPDKPLVVSMLFNGALPNRGIAYLDETGRKRFFTVIMSGKDESLLLNEFTPADGAGGVAPVPQKAGRQSFSGRGSRLPALGGEPLSAAFLLPPETASRRRRGFSRTSARRAWCNPPPAGW